MLNRNEYFTSGFVITLFKPFMSTHKTIYIIYKEADISSIHLTHRSRSFRSDVTNIANKNKNLEKCIEVLVSFRNRQPLYFSGHCVEMNEIKLERLFRFYKYHPYSWKQSMFLSIFTVGSEIKCNCFIFCYRGYLVQIVKFIFLLFLSGLGFFKKNSHIVRMTENCFNGETKIFTS